jgi:hypothetical protein
MKYISIKLIIKYRKYYSNFYIAIIIKLITFFLPITYITKIIKKIKD